MSPGIIRCPGCGQERWAGIGPCANCGAPSPLPPPPDPPPLSGWSCTTGRPLASWAELSKALLAQRLD